MNTKININPDKTQDSDSSRSNNAISNINLQRASSATTNQDNMLMAFDTNSVQETNQNIQSYFNDVSQVTEGDSGQSNLGFNAVVNSTANFINSSFNVTINDSIGNTSDNYDMSGTYVTQEYVTLNTNTTHSRANVAYTFDIKYHTLFFFIRLK